MLNRKNSESILASLHVNSVRFPTRRSTWKSLELRYDLLLNILTQYSLISIDKYSLLFSIHFQRTYLQFNICFNVKNCSRFQHSLDLAWRVRLSLKRSKGKHECFTVEYWFLKPGQVINTQYELKKGTKNIYTQCKN